ncbi:MAG: hypothetical protein NTW21_21110 [Verrucomicrobia bacterium]|nr:hypothetical protein [Verrucomicrobiota bacterium]
MNRHPLPPDDSWESDAVWKLLDQAPPRAAGPRFADNTARAARLAGTPRAWWQRLGAPIPLVGLGAATASLALAFMALTHPPTHPADPSTASNDEAFAAIQRLAEAEVLSAAVDNLDDFTDTELVSLIGF